MRIPSDLTTDPSPRRRHRARWWLIGFVVVLVILLVSLRSLAGLYTDSLWFSSVGYHNVCSTLLVIKVGLFGVFGAIFFAILWVNLVVCDRIAGQTSCSTQEDELVRRYQQDVRPYSGRIYVALAFVIALIAASGTIGEWQNWILFRHGGNFGVKDPQFHNDVGFFVFDLPVLDLRRQLDAGHPGRDRWSSRRCSTTSTGGSGPSGPAAGAPPSRRTSRCCWP